MIHSKTLTSRVAATSFVAALLLAACAPAGTPVAVTPSTKPVTGASAAPDAAHAEAIHWSYEGNTGADKWGSLDASYAVCASGQTQTPVDITSPKANPSLPDLALAYTPGAAEIVNNGHTVQANVPAGSVLRVGASTFQLLQYHFHAPSEHTINGKAFPMEMHFVHKDESGNLGVLGVMYQAGAANPAYDALVGNLPAAENDKATLPSFNPMTLLPATFGYYRYDGSLTTPPCSEGVRWMLLSTPVTLSQGQIDKFTARYARNARPVQPLGQRIVEQK